MNRILISLILFCAIEMVPAETLHVTVGDTGCPGRQTGVTQCWEKIPGVVSVTVLPRRSKDPAAQRIFVIVTKATAPTEGLLREALGRRAKHYPILKCEIPADPNDH